MSTPLSLMTTIGNNSAGLDDTPNIRTSNDNNTSNFFRSVPTCNNRRRSSPGSQ